jgi:hypothetical protein
MGKCPGPGRKISGITPDADSPRRHNTARRMWRTIHLELALERNHEPIAGVVSSETEPSRSFEGWLELASAIEEARTDEAGARNGEPPASVKPPPSSLRPKPRRRRRRTWPRHLRALGPKE